MPNPTRKAKPKSPKQLQREIDEVLAKSPSFPSLRITTVRPYTVDEWYGVKALFEWTSPFDYDAFKRAVSAEERAWFDANPRKMHVGLWPLEEKMANHLRKQILSTSEWKTSSQGFKDFDEWEINSTGGRASASARNEDSSYDDYDD